jgi:hypothetical protein
VCLVVFLVSLLGLAGSSKAEGPVEHFVARTVSDAELPGFLQRAHDIRWAADSSVFLGVPRGGVFQVSLDELAKSPVRETVDGNGIDNSWNTTRLAVTSEHIVFGAELFTFGWKKRGEEKPQRVSHFFEGIEDLDAFEGRYAVLGMRRGYEGVMAPGGHIAWVGNLGDEVPEPEPVLTSRSGPGAPLMDNCPTFSIGGVRFLPDGSLVVVPGFEPGAYRFDEQGKLLEIWDTEALGIGADCDFDTEQRDLLSRDPHARWAYINQFRAVDEILVLDGRPVLVVRRVEGKQTLWELVTLEPYGRASRRPLPLTAESPFAHLRGDVRDGHVVFLLFDFAGFLRDQSPASRQAVPPRLLVMDLAANSTEGSSRTAEPTAQETRTPSSRSPKSGS